MHKDIEDTFTKILEDWGMMLVEEHLPWEGISQALDRPDKVLIARVKYHGTIDGAYTIACKEEFAEALFENILGKTEEIEGDPLKDILCELANVISGNLLTTCFGEHHTFALDAPQCVVASLEEAEKQFAHNTKNGFVCVADGGKIVLAHEISDPV